MSLTRMAEDLSQEISKLENDNEQFKKDFARMCDIFYEDQKKLYQNSLVIAAQKERIKELQRMQLQRMPPYAAYMKQQSHVIALEADLLEQKRICADLRADKERLEGDVVKAEINACKLGAKTLEANAARDRMQETLTRAQAEGTRLVEKLREADAEISRRNTAAANYCIFRRG